MTEIVSCKVCGSLMLRNQINGKCYTCGRFTCKNCYRICDNCTRIFCMNHVEKKIVMRQQEPFLHQLCERCTKVW